MLKCIKKLVTVQALVGLRDKRWSRSLEVISRQRILKKLPVGLALFFKFSYAMLIELFSFRGQISISNYLRLILSHARGPPLEKTVF